MPGCRWKARATDFLDAPTPMALAAFRPVPISFMPAERESQECRESSSRSHGLDVDSRPFA
jgi:hypothetical protein